MSVGVRSTGGIPVSCKYGKTSCAAHTDNRSNKAYSMANNAERLSVPPESTILRVVAPLSE